MKSEDELLSEGEKFATTICWRRLIVLAVFLWSAVANCSLFTFHSSLLQAQVQTGFASFYAKRATGARTANGERLHHDSLTCAHRTLPFGTFLKVTNLANGLSTIVRVNDRGPFVKGRVIDLSWGAAKEIGMLAHGVVPVTIEEAYYVVIPLKAPIVRMELPKLEVPNIEMPDTLRTIWQEDQLIVH